MVDVNDRSAESVCLSARRRRRFGARSLRMFLVGAAVVSVCLAGILVFHSTPAARRRANQTRDSQTETSKIQYLIRGEANDERGYLLSGDPMFLAHFTDKQGLLEVQIGLLVDHAPATVRAAVAAGLPDYRAFLSDHAQVIALFQSGERVGATALALGHDRQSRKSAEAAFAVAATEVVSAANRATGEQNGLTDLAGVGVIVLGLGLLLVAAESVRRLAKQQRDGAALRDSERHLRMLVDHAPLAVYAVDLDGVVTAWNTVASSMFGWSEAEAMGRMLPFVAAEDRGEFAQLRAEAVAGRHLDGWETTRRHRDGSVIDVSISTAPVLDDTGQVIGIIGITADITGRKRTEVELESHRRNDQQLASIVAASADAIMSTSLDGTITSWNVGAEAMFGHRAIDIIGQPVSMLGRPRDHGEQAHLIDRALNRQSLIGKEMIAVRTGGMEFPAAITTSPILNSANVVVGLSCVIRDITVQKALEATLERRAFHDELTGLPNRLLFVDRLTDAIPHLGQSTGLVAVLFIDIDQFKVINDSLGHLEGDRILIMVAERLRAEVRPGDTVARFGGDEFAVLCEDLDDDADALMIAERIQHAGATPFSLNGRDHHVTLSTGIAIARSADASPSDLLRDADAAMYAAKDAGRSCSIVFAESMRKRALRRLDVEISLRRAITHGEFRLHYQPIVNLRTGRVDGVEALVRWQHPIDGLLLPSEFIGIAEETGLIVPLGEWVLGEACRQARDWHADPDLAHLTVSVNLSGCQIAEPDIVAVVTNILDQTGLCPSRLVLEITESVLMRDATRSITVINALKTLGISLSVDDFGTGYSSLSYLKKFRVDILKIDKSFVDGIGVDHDDDSIIAATINLARSLRLATIAEGVETADQVTALTALGCDKAQGYHFGCAQPANEIIDALHTPRRSTIATPSANLYTGN